MMQMRFAIRTGISTLRSRPALTVLAVLLLGFGVAVLGSVAGSLYLLRSLRSEFQAAMSVELELTGDSESVRAAVMQRAEDWPNAEFVQYVSPEMSLREVERETGEHLNDLFTVNPFPPMVRVRFGKTTIRTVDSLAAIAGHWPEVTQAVYPKRLWADLERFEERSRSVIAGAVLLFGLVIVGLVGLCLRAQISYREKEFDFLRLTGASRWTLRWARLFHQVVVGIVGGLLGTLLLWGMCNVSTYLLLRDLTLPIQFYGATALASVVVALIAGLLFVRCGRQIS
jgi:cell division protein FtsX